MPPLPVSHRTFPSRLVLGFMLATACAGGLSACGQKGPLFLPGDPSTIYAAPPQQTNQAAEEVEEEDDDESPNTIQN